jgi:hypothetical protein
MLMEEDEEVPAIFSGESCTFTSIGARVEDFRFLGAESFGSAEIFCFLETTLCLSFSIDRISCLFKMLTILFFFAPPASSSSLSYYEYSNPRASITRFSLRFFRVPKAVVIN